MLECALSLSPSLKKKNTATYRGARREPTLCVLAACLVWSSAHTHTHTHTQTPDASGESKRQLTSRRRAAPARSKTSQLTTRQTHGAARTANRARLRCAAGADHPSSLTHAPGGHLTDTTRAERGGGASEASRAPHTQRGGRRQPECLGKCSFPLIFLNTTQLARAGWRTSRLAAAHAGGLGGGRCGTL